MVNRTDNVIYLHSSSPRNGEERNSMWEEVALKYQQILHREYRMLNLPSYPVPGGNLYFYYVPVIINPQLVAENYDVQNACDSKRKAADDTSAKSEDIIYISDNSEDDSITCVKKEPIKFEETVEKSCSFGEHVKEESHNGRLISCKVEKSQCNDRTSASNKEKYLTTVKMENDSDHRNPCVKFMQDTKITGGEKREILYDNGNVEHLKQSGYCSDNNVEVRDGHIRIIKGYTIEYHPLHSASMINRSHSPSEMESQQDRKIQDLKKRLLEQEVELAKLRMRQSVEQDVSISLHANGSFKQECVQNGEKVEFTSHRAWKPIRGCPSTQVHYFPSGERKTSPPRRHSRKQTSPRRIDALFNTKTKKDIVAFIKNVQMEGNINGDVNHDFSVSKRKRKLTPSPELEQEMPVENNRDKPVACQNNSHKRGQTCKKVKVQSKRRKRRHISQFSDQNLQGSQPQRGKTQANGSCTENLCKGTTPQDMTQDKFLSIFGLTRISGQKGGTLNN